MSSFNLCDEPWIPIAGEPERKSLTQIFSERSLHRLSGNAVDKIVIFRFLLSVVHASTQVPDETAWQTLTTGQIAENALHYLEEHHDDFDLYGEKPFLQFPQLAEAGGKVTSLGSMQVSVADGNKTILSGWNCFTPPSDADKAILLLRSSCYGCGGKKYDKSVVLTPGMEKGATGSGGTLLGFNGLLHVYLLGSTLLETLYLNLLPDSEMADIRFSAKGVPFWENMPTGEEDDRAKEYRSSYFGQLFPIDKFLLLKDDGMIKTSGIPYFTGPEEMKDPALTVVQKGKDLRFVNAKTDKRPWRELEAMLAFLENSERRQPFFLSLGAKRLRHSAIEKITVWTGGMTVNANSGEQYLSGKCDYVESEFSFPADCMIPESLNRWRKIMETLEKNAKQLYASIASYYKEMNSEDGKGQGESGTVAFWEQLEPRAQEFLELAFSDASEENIQEKLKSCFAVLCDIFNELCPRETPRQMAAWVNCNPGFGTIKKQKEKK